MNWCSHYGILFSHKKETLPFAALRMDLVEFMLTEISQTQKDKYCMTSLTGGIYKS